MILAFRAENPSKDLYYTVDSYVCENLTNQLYGNNDIFHLSCYYEIAHCYTCVEVNVKLAKVELHHIARVRLSQDECTE